MSDKNSEEATHKIGAGHAQAMFRVGLAEVRNIFSFTGSNITAPGDAGLYGNATQADVRDQRRGDLQPSADNRESVLDDRLNQAQKHAEASRDAPGKDRSSLEKE